ncbi:unnamed protein product [Rotaria sp. Silwood2]|nr:unnamed protein product [Rotaria sp. Silwood2]
MLLFICVVLSYINLISGTTYQCDPSISCGCSVSTTNVTSRIVGGEAASDYAWGWIVSLQFFGEHQCGASLLTPEYAVTSAHCADGLMNYIYLFSILAGTNYLDDASISTIQRRSIISITMHPKYDPVTIENDIAILKFSPLTIYSNSKITFICLPKEYEDPFQTNNNLVAIGWGYLWEDLQYLSNSLQQVTVQAYSSTSNECQQSGMTNPLVQFCAGTMAGDTCQGDSGGPLMAFVNNRWVLAGITSRGNGCARVGYPGVYTRVSSFISFINSNVDFPRANRTTTPIGEITMIEVVEATTIPMTETTTIQVTEATTVSMRQTTTVAMIEATTLPLAKTTTIQVTEATTVSMRQSTMIAMIEVTTVPVAKTTTIQVTEATTVSMRQTTVFSLATLTSQGNNNQSSTQGNDGNMINKSITIVIFWFLFLVCLSFSY